MNISPMVTDAAVLVISLILGYLIGRYIRVSKQKPQGEIRFYIQDDGDGIEFISCSISPDGEWEEVMKQTDILFRVTKEPRIEQILKESA